MNLKNYFQIYNRRDAISIFHNAFGVKYNRFQYGQKIYIRFDIFITNTVLLALAYVPENYVIDAFEEFICSQYYADHENILQPLIDYFEDNWIGHPMGQKKGRRLPKYPISLWNCYESATNLLD